MTCNFHILNMVHDWMTTKDISRGNIFCNSLCNIKYAVLIPVSSKLVRKGILHNRSDNSSSCFYISSQSIAICNWVPVASIIGTGEDDIIIKKSIDVRWIGADCIEYIDNRKLVT